MPGPGLAGSGTLSVQSKTPHLRPGRSFTCTQRGAVCLTSHHSSRLSNKGTLETRFFLILHSVSPGIIFRGFVESNRALAYGSMQGEPAVERQARTSLPGSLHQWQGCAVLHVMSPC